MKISCMESLSMNGDIGLPGRMLAIRLSSSDSVSVGLYVPLRVRWKNGRYRTMAVTAAAKERPMKRFITFLP